MSALLSKHDLRTPGHQPQQAVIPLPELPADRRRGPTTGFSAARMPLEISSALAESIRGFDSPDGVTPMEFVAAALQTFLFRYTGESDLLIGFRAGWIRCDLSGEPTFREVLDCVRAAITADLLDTDSAAESSARFTVTLMDEDDSRPTLERGTGPDLSVLLRETADKLTITWEYNARLFEASTIGRMARHFRTLLESANANPDERIGRLPLLSKRERHQLLVDWNHTSVSFPRDCCIHELFQEHAARHPDRVAVLFQDEQITYRELNARANRLAHRLRALGVGPDILVGICLERSLETVIALLATLKAGGAYVPLDPAYPPQRLAIMIADMAAPILLTQRRLVSLLPPHQARVLCLDDEAESWAAESTDNLDCRTTAENLAYMIYTSGSTGKPKGVCVPHRGVVRLVKNMDYVDFGPDDTFLHVTSLSFDPSTFEIWMPLVNGARLAVYPPGPVSLGGLGKKIRQYGVTTLQLTTPMFHLMVDENLEAFRGLRAIVTGGEAFSVDHAQRALDGLPTTRISFCYGPTENSVITSAYRPTRSADLRSFASVPIGRPIVNTEVYVLDEYLQPVPVGVTGELYTGGDGLARGYLNRPELTAERFIPHPFRPDSSARLYRTGDLARYLPDGTLEFRGRIDHQVKIRGYRIELGEVEQALCQHPAVREAVVIAREDTLGKKYLAAYFLAETGPKPTAIELTRFLRTRLPAYMVPAAFVVLPALPLSPNGKLDRRRLPTPEHVRE